ncbi:insulinase [Clostridium puniceum]|uniref:Insulinase n=1 Tax=Clostridium puniceum TaxID=29367 RepID=A0A1S8TWA8_9CLOT|nr:insulinase family protein [Clostridium puniceum]OOM82001.1 insulinase [Clostridium puniceum]
MRKQKKLIGKLESGMKYYIYNNNIKEKIRFILLRKTGSLNDEKNKNGLAHLSEHMCLSQKILNESVLDDNFFNFINIKKYNFSGYTDFDRTVLRIYRRNEVNNLKDDFYIIQNIINGDVFRKEVLSKVKNDVIYECEYYKNKNKIQEKIIEFITNGSVKELPMGTPKLIEKITMKELLEFHNKNYTLDKEAIIIIGDVDVIEVEKMIIEIFNNEKSVTRVSKVRKKSILPYLKNEVLILEDIEKNYNVVKLYYRFMFDNSNLKKRLIRYFFDRMLENYIQNEFQFNNINIIDIGCTDKRNIDQNDYFIVVYKVDKLEETENLYMRIIDKLIKDGFKQEEFKAQLDILQDILTEIINEENALPAEEICEEYIKNFFDNQAILLVNEDYNEIIKIINQIDINDINHLLKQILNGYCKIVKVRGTR